MTAAILLAQSESNNLVTTLYNGSGAARSLVTGQNLAADGLVWLKNRSTDRDHQLFDTARGALKVIESNTARAEATDANGLTTFNSNGFSIGTSPQINTIGSNYVAWSFLKKTGFLDIVRGSGDGASSKTYNHALGAGSTVGSIIAKQTNASTNWIVFHKELGNTKGLLLNSTSAEIVDASYWSNTSPTSTQFTVGSLLNNIGTENYIFYIFAHNPAQKIYCGTFTTDGSGNATVTGVGFRPKLIDLKRTDAAGDWHRLDEKRGFDKQLKLNTSDAETTVSYMAVTSDGFTLTGYTPSATGVFWAVG